MHRFSTFAPPSVEPFTTHSELSASSEDCKTYPFNQSSKQNNTKQNNTNQNNTNNSTTVNLIEIDSDNSNNHNSNAHGTELELKESMIEVSDHESECDPPNEFMRCHIDGTYVCKYGCAFTSMGFRCFNCKHKKRCVCNHHKLSIILYYFLFDFYYVWIFVLFYVCF